jgi:hypothetical protein
LRKEKRKSDRKDFFLSNKDCEESQNSGRNNINHLAIGLFSSLTIVNLTVPTPLSHTSALRTHAAAAKLREKPTAATLHGVALIANLKISPIITATTKATK